MHDGRLPQLILASASQTRVAMLRAAGLEFDAVAADIDEPALHHMALADDDAVSASSVASLLARAKAVEVSLRFPHALVIGGDQVLALGSDMLFKAADVEGAKRTLLRLKGQTHVLHSAAALAIDGRADWSALDTAQLTMRDFSQNFLDNYLARAGSALTSSVGCYEIEGIGLNLFEKVTGHHATILGLPLLPLLAELRARGVLPS